MQFQLARVDDPTSDWQAAAFAFLAEKEHRSGSLRTVGEYARTLQRFFGQRGWRPDQVTAKEVFGFAYGIGLSGKKPSPATIGARLACISSFYRFLLRMGLVSSNPCDRLERPRVPLAPPRGLTAEEIRGVLSVIPNTPAGVRDRALIVMLALTGRRRMEVLNLTVGSIRLDQPTYTYRAKGGKIVTRELPLPVIDAVFATLRCWGKDFNSMPADESLWPSQTGSKRGLAAGSFYRNFRTYLVKAGLPPAGVHILRHSAAKLRRDAGESVETVSEFLDHSSIATTSVYLRRLEGAHDKGWEEVAKTLGL